MLQVVATDKAPKAVGPYSQAIIANGFIFVSGQIAFDPATGELNRGTIEEQTRQVLKNVNAVLETVGASLASVVKTTVFMKNLAEFDAMNQTYAEFFPGTKPARATVEVARLPKDVSVEIEAIAVHTPA